jgi:hypothetical protein
VMAKAMLAMGAADEMSKAPNRLNVQEHHISDFAKKLHDRGTPWTCPVTRRSFWTLGGHHMLTPSFSSHAWASVAPRCSSHGLR